MAKADCDHSLQAYEKDKAAELKNEIKKIDQEMSDNWLQEKEIAVKFEKQQELQGYNDIKSQTDEMKRKINGIKTKVRDLEHSI